MPPPFLRLGGLLALLPPNAPFTLASILNRMPLSPLDFQLFVDLAVFLGFCDHCQHLPEGAARLAVEAWRGYGRLTAVAVFICLLNRDWRARSVRDQYTLRKGLNVSPRRGGLDPIDFQRPIRLTGVGRKEMLDRIQREKVTVAMRWNTESTKLQSSANE